MIPMYTELNSRRDTLILLPVGDDASPDDLRQQARMLSTLTPLITPSIPPGGLLIPLSWPAVVQLSARLGPFLTLGPRLREWVTAHRRHWSTSEALTVDIPSGLVPRSYQLAGARMIAAAGRVILGDDAGVGKTVTTLLGLAQRDQDGQPVRPILVVCPASVIHSWIEHVTTWCPQWRVVEWRGPGRQELLHSNADVFVTSYATMRIDVRSKRSPLVKLAAATVVYDEHHVLADPKAQQTQAARKLAHRATTFVGLSGTPITHSPADLWPVLDMMDPQAWPSRERWVDRYCLTAPRDYGVDCIGLDPSAEAELRLSLYGRMRRVAKADVLAELPPKVYTTRIVDLPREWRTAYDTLARDMLAQLPNGSDLPVMDVLSQLVRLNQLACAAADITVAMERDEETGLDRPHYAVALRAPSWKVDVLLDILAERPGQQTVVFASSAQLIRIAADQLSAVGYRVGCVVGGQTATVRTSSISAFQAGTLAVLCVTTGAGGVGLTLTAANTVVFLQRPWSLVESLQAEDRCHRLGSERHAAIEIIDIIAADTVDSRIRAALHDKAGQLADLVQDRRIVSTLLGGRKKVTSDQRVRDRDRPRHDDRTRPVVAA